MFAWLMPFAVLLLPAGLALFTGLAAGVARLAWPPGIARVLVLAVALALTEWLRGHVLTGFPWNVLGYALTWPLPMMQSAAVLGIYGLTLLCVAIFAGPLVLIADAASGASRGARPCPRCRSGDHAAFAALRPRRLAAFRQSDDDARRRARA